MAQKLTVENLSFSYEKSKSTLDKVSFNLSTGEVGCFLGPSGCGKTTLLRCLAGFETPQEGVVVLGNRVLHDKSRSLAPEERQVGMIFQEFALFPHLTAKENILFGLSHLNSIEREERLKEILEITGLKDYSKSYPHEISGGQQQRVALARALAPRPDLLLMDEPFSNLDTDLRVSMRKQVLDIIRSLKITTVMVTHDQEEAFQMADWVGVMVDGELKQWDRSSNIYQQPRTKNVAELVGRGAFVKIQSVKVLREDPKNGLKKVQVETVLGTLEVLFYPTTGKDADTLSEVFVRPEDLMFMSDGVILGEVVDCDYRGPYWFYKLKIKSDEIILHIPIHYPVYKHGQLIPIKKIARQFMAY